MFTGLIREIATVKSFTNNILSIKSSHKAKLGDSIAVNGACLTVIKVNNDGFSVELSPESQKVLAIQNYKNKVHIEPAMMMGDRFEGHIVQGHIDCVGTIKNINDNGNSKDFIIELPKEYIKYIIPKGSIAIDGISLTINEIYDDSFRLTIIPHTIKNTLFQTYNIGTRVNIETDMFARYIFNMFHKDKQNSTLSWEQVDMMMNRY
jgi:riboflavin synthase